MPAFNALLLFIASAALASTRAAVLTGCDTNSGTTTSPTTVTTAPSTTPTVCAPLYAQCTSPNFNWFGPPCCEGSTCTELNPFWAQCL
ncbi:hypothetical protein B0H11DRAFT_2281148 [Mycena galericulata]|nr:hypothetical protein B0H11DRAFT_2281148 [Mycena galericulata]